MGLPTTRCPECGHDGFPCIGTFVRRSRALRAGLALALPSAVLLTAVIATGQWFTLVVRHLPTYTLLNIHNPGRADSDPVLIELRDRWLAGQLDAGQQAELLMQLWQRGQSATADARSASHRLLSLLAQVAPSYPLEPLAARAREALATDAAGLDDRLVEVCEFILTDPRLPDERFQSMLRDMVRPRVIVEADEGMLEGNPILLRLFEAPLATAGFGRGERTTVVPLADSSPFVTWYAPRRQARGGDVVARLHAPAGEHHVRAQVVLSRPSGFGSGSLSVSITGGALGPVSATRPWPPTMPATLTFPLDEVIVVQALTDAPTEAQQLERRLRQFVRVADLPRFTTETRTGFRRAEVLRFAGPHRSQRFELDFTLAVEIGGTEVDAGKGSLRVADGAYALDYEDGRDQSDVIGQGLICAWISKEQSRAEPILLIMRVHRLVLPDGLVFESADQPIIVRWSVPAITASQR